MRKRDLRFRDDSTMGRGVEGHARNAGLKATPATSGIPASSPPQQYGPGRVAATPEAGIKPGRPSVESSLPTISELVRQVKAGEIDIDRAAALASARTELGICNECDRKILDPEWGGLCDMCKEEE